MSLKNFLMLLIVVELHGVCTDGARYTSVWQRGHEAWFERDSGAVVTLYD